MSHLGQIETGDRGASRDKLLVISTALRLENEEQEELLIAGGFFPRDEDHFDRADVIVRGEPPAREDLAALAGADDLTPDRRARLLGYFQALMDEQEADDSAREANGR